MPRLYRISSALAKRPASIHRKSATRPRAKLQKSHAALQEFVTAMLHSPGPPLRTKRRTSQAFAILLATSSPRGSHDSAPSGLPAIRFRNRQQVCTAETHARHGLITMGLREAAVPYAL